MTRLDHDANVRPWVLAAEDAGATVRWVDVREEDVTIDGASFEAALSERTKVVAFTLASNAVGTVTPAADLVRLVRDGTSDAIVACDGVHLAQHRSIDVREIGADLVVCSPYKIFGHARDPVRATRLLSVLRPYKVRPAEDALPFAFETGTQNHEGFAGWIAAVGYLAELGEGGGAVGRPSAPRSKRDRAVGGRAVRRFLEGIREIPSVRLYGIAEPSARASARPRSRSAWASNLRRDREDARRARDLRVGRQLLRDRDHGAARAAGLGRCSPDRVLPLQHADEVDRVLEELATLA